LAAFGEKLRKQREQRGIALEAISSTTKISTRMLRALEEENFSQLPGGVFNKGFVRAYARHVGIDEEEAIADYLEALRERQIQTQKVTPDFRAPAHKPLAAPSFKPSSDDSHEDFPHERSGELVSSPGGENHGHPASDPRRQDRRHGTPRNNDPGLSGEDPHGGLPDGTQAGEGPRVFTRSATEPPPQPSSGPFFAHIPWGALAAALIVLFAALAFWNMHRHSRPYVSPARENPAHESATPVPASGPPTSRQPVSNASLKTASTPAVPGKSSSSTRHTSAAKASPASPATSSSATATATPATSSPGPASNRAPGAERRATDTTSSALVTLVIRAEKTSWVSITVDGKPVAAETLIAPAETSVRGSSIVVKTGNSAGISFLFDGKQIPAQGLDGEVRTYSFDSSGMKSPATQSPTEAH
jgi:cytoskeletal protein RodZ